jgi:hypothetical protein
MTESALRTRIKMAANFAAITKKLCDEICNAITDVPDDSIYDILDKIQSGEMSDVDEIIAALDGDDNYLSDGLDKADKEADAYEQNIPEINVTAGNMIDIKVPVNGGYLVAGNGKSDYGTEQIYLTYECNGYVIDLALAEVKAGELAKIENKPADNKDIDVYTYEDAHSEDWTRKFVLEYKDIEAVTTDD